MTALDLDAIQARADAATPGPWTAQTTGERGGDHWYVCDAGEAIAHIAAQDGINEAQREPDAQFFAHSRTDVVDLIARIRELEAAIDSIGTVIDDPDGYGWSDESGMLESIGNTVESVGRPVIWQ
ncbi:hypothetical protein [Rhodococcoides fascians]|uniref:hypothetical protein n=1 Tax=Rhodococcoides fascians TaxID=1828 RepID=UPI00050C3691|nr:hypothetical protein [Rhodococcus fascians]